MTNQVIPDEAVEAAARAHQEMRAKLGYPQWDELNEMGHQWRLDHMRPALEAAAPHMLAAAYDLGIQHGANQPPNPYLPGQSRSGD